MHHADKSIGGANNVRVSVEELGADRIGHGVKSNEDPAVERMMVERQIPLELCPTSNVQTQAVTDMASHPLPHYHSIGAKVTVNNDDPGVSGITLSDDYVNISQAFGFSIDDLRTFVDNGVDAAFASDEVKADVRGQVEDGFAAAEQDLFDTLTLNQLEEMALSGTQDAAEQTAIRQEFAGLQEWIIS